MAFVLVALAPLVAIKWIADQELARSRDWWLLALLAVGGAAAWSTAPWLTPMALWFVLFWRDRQLVPSVAIWVGIGASWYAFRSIPEQAWPWLSWAWLGVMVWHVAILALTYHHHPAGVELPPEPTNYPAWLRRLTAEASDLKFRRPRGLYGSAPTTALYLALVSPFCPWWLWPVLALGLYLTGSVLAILAVLIGMAMVLPSPWSGLLLGALALATGGITYVWLWRRRHEGRIPGHFFMKRFTTRGPATKTITVRGNVYVLMWHLARSASWRLNLTGRGPGTSDIELQPLSFRSDLGIPGGHCHNDALQHVWDYGAFGLIALGLFAWQVGWGLRLGDPWSAALVVGAILSLGHFPMRLPQVALPWLAIAARVAV